MSPVFWLVTALWCLSAGFWYEKIRYEATPTTFDEWMVVVAGVAWMGFLTHLALTLV